MATDSVVAANEIDLIGEFRSATLEMQFRDKNQAADLFLVKILAVLGVLANAYFLINDFRLHHLAPQFFILLGLRTSLVALSAGIWYLANRSLAPRRMDRLLLLWCALVATAVLYINSTRPVSYTGHIATSLGLVLIVYCMVPMPLRLQILVSVPYSVAAVVQVAWVANDELSRNAALGCFALANAFAAAISWQSNSGRRQSYLLIRTEAELRAKLEQSLAEVKTLRGLLRICSWCKRIRDEEKSWQPIESYVMDNSHAEFTHGICPTCLHEQCGELDSGTTPI